MQKVKNNYYVATSILYFINGALSILGGLCYIGIGILAASDVGGMIQAFVEDGYVLEEAQMMAQISSIVFIVIGSLTALMSIYMFIAGVKYKKYSNLTNEEATKYYGKCIAWCVCSFLFAGMLIGVISCIGLCTVQEKQKNGEIGVETQPQQAEQKTENKSTITVQNLDVLKERLERLEALKQAEAITEEEYQNLRVQIMGTKKEQPVNEQEKAKNERLENLNSLKESGALSQEEFDILKKQIEEK